MLDEICREGARRMLAAALEAEADACIAELAGEVDERGHRMVTRNGHARPLTITTGSGPIRIEAPRVNERRVDPDSGGRQRFRSSIVPPWARRSLKVPDDVFAGDRRGRAGTAPLDGASPYGL